MNFKGLVKQIGAKIWENRSNIEFVVGTGMVIAGTGMIMSKAEEAVDVKNEFLAQKKTIELKDENDDWDSMGQRTKACAKMVKDTFVGYGKCYGPGLAVEIGGLVLQGVSHATDRSEIVSISAALASTTMEFAQYRERVREELGDEKDEQFLLGKPDAVDVNEEGKVVKESYTKLPDHSFLFDECNNNYDDRGFSNLEFLEDHERWLNERLQREGFLWENDIRRDVGAPVDPLAESWGITAVDENGNTNYISFGIQRNTERAQAFREGTEKSFLVILNNMEPKITKKLYRLQKYHKDITIAG